MKYHTRPIDFTGCHPVIAEALKRGKEIECFVHDSPARDHRRRWVSAYLNGEKYPYITREEAFRYAEPIPIKPRRIMPPERAIPVLIAEGWRFNHNGQMVRAAQTILPAMFCSMGSRLDDPNTISWSWPPCIIEEVEDDDLPDTSTETPVSEVEE